MNLTNLLKKFRRTALALSVRVMTQIFSSTKTRKNNIPLLQAIAYNIYKHNITTNDLWRDNYCDFFHVFHTTDNQAMTSNLQN